MARLVRRSLIAAAVVGALLLAALAPASPERLAALAREQEAAQKNLRQAVDLVAVATGKLENLKATNGEQHPTVQQAQREVAAQKQRAAAAQQRLDEIEIEIAQTKQQAQADAEAQRETATSDVEARLEAARARARELAASENPAAQLSDAIADAALERLRVTYRSAALRAATTRRLYELGRIESSELYEAEAAADAALADVREAELQRMLDRVQRERANGAAAAAVPPTTNPTTATEAVQEQAQQVIQADRQVLQAEYFRGYLETVRRYGELVSDPAAARVAAVITAAEILANRPPAEAVAYFQAMLNELPTGPDASPADMAVRRVIHFQIADFQRISGDEAAALEQLRTLAVGTPGATEAAKPAPQQAQSNARSQGS